MFAVAWVCILPVPLWLLAICCDRSWLKSLCLPQAQHTAIRVTTIMLQQMLHQLPDSPHPLGATYGFGHSRITYLADRVVKRVDWWRFANQDLEALSQVYAAVWASPDGAGISHPRGLIRPLVMPALVTDSVWCVHLPVGLAHQPLSPPRLRCLILDVLHGLAHLHAASHVHRDVRLPNTVEVSKEVWLSLLRDFAAVHDAFGIPAPVSAQSAL